MNWGWGRGVVYFRQTIPECLAPQDVLLLGGRGGVSIQGGLRGRVLRFGPTTRPVWGLCTCVCPRPPRSPYTPRRSTIWTCIRTWWSAWLAWCRSPAHSTWPHSRLCHGTSYCSHGQRCPGSLHMQEEGSVSWLIKTKTNDLFLSL